MSKQVSTLSLMALGLSLMLAPHKVSAAALIEQTFEENDGGWQALGQSAKISVTHDEANVKEGKGALQLNYNVAKGEFNAATLPVQDAALANLKSLRFWVKADVAAPLVIILQEKDEGRYTSTFSVPANKWQQVQLSPADFTLSTNPDDPKDPDNKLDLEKIQTIGIIDLSEILAQSDNVDLRTLFNIKNGPHTLYVDGFVASSDPLPAEATPAAGEVPLDTFAHPQLSWMIIGVGQLSRSNGKPLEGPGLQVDYRQAPGKIIGWIKPLAPNKLKGMAQLAFPVASIKAAKLMIQVEETDGGKYNTVVQVPGGSQASEMHINFADMTAADDAHDGNNKLDLDLIHQILIFDASGLLDQADQDNTLWIGSLRAVPAKP